MIRLEIKCTKIRSLEEINAITYPSGHGQMVENFESIEKCWKRVNSYVKPGKSVDNTIALRIDMVMNGECNGAYDPQIYAAQVSKFLVKEFRKEGILSLVYYLDGSTPVCSAVVYPLAGRLLKPEKWLNSIHPTKLKDKYIESIETLVKEQFPDLVLSSNEGSGMDLSDLGYSEKLINYKPAPFMQEYASELTFHTSDDDASVQSEVPFDEMRKILNATLDYFTFGPEHVMFERAQRGDDEITPEVFLSNVEGYLTRTYRKLKKNDISIVREKLYNAVFQNYILEPLIDDDRISDIKVISWDKIRVKVGGERYTSNIKFASPEDYLRFINGLAVRNNLDLETNAINVFSDVTSNEHFRMRFNITTPYINSSRYPYLHIRKIAKEKRDMDYLINKGHMLDRQIADYLIDQARNGKGLIFTGKGASGKTTLMNCLLDYVPFNKSGLVIQESDELFSDVHPDFMFQHVTMNVLPGRPIYDLQDEARNGLLTDLDYFIIGEIKGAEAKYFINAADTGHRCWCSVHSPSSTDAIDKLADYIMYDTPYSKDEATYMLKDLGVVVFMKNFKVCEISEISGWDKEKRCLIYTPIYRRPVIAA